MYRVQKDKFGCNCCEHGSMWVIRSPTGGILGKSFTSEVDANSTCQMLNDARDKATKEAFEIKKSTIERVAATGTADEFLNLSDEQKCIWFALALKESTRRKNMHILLDEILSCWDLYSEHPIPEYFSNKITELLKDLY